MNLSRLAASTNATPACRLVHAGVGRVAGVERDSTSRVALYLLFREALRLDKVAHYRFGGG